MKTTSIMELGKRIRLERQKRSWTQEQLAERAKVNPRTIQRAENGAEISAETLRLVAEAFGLTAEQLRATEVRERFTPSFKRYAPYVGAVQLILCLSVVMAAMFIGLGNSYFAGIVGAALYFIFGTLFASVTGYSVANGQLHVHHSFWATRYNLSELSAVAVKPDAVVGAWPYWGLITCYGFIARYRSVTMGKFTGYVSNDRDCVVMDFGKKRVIATIADPEAFAEALQEAAKGCCQRDGTRAAVEA